MVLVGARASSSSCRVQKGVLPMILEELLAARKRAKTDMAKATDPFVIAGEPAAAASMAPTCSIASSP